MTFKEKVHASYLRLLQDKLTTLERNMSDLNASAANETKSTAGDKHETALAMLQIEQDNLRKQMAVVKEQLVSLHNLQHTSTSNSIVKGSLVETGRGYLYLSAALGKLDVEGKSIIALSVQSPLGSRLLGKIKGDQVEINGITYTIFSIW